ncbi:MAG: hypothetical protein PVJ60_02200 [Phycisphaerales bacterium]|jgi:hypothetical protein
MESQYILTIDGVEIKIRHTSDIWIEEDCDDPKSFFNGKFHELLEKIKD